MATKKVIASIYRVTLIKQDELILNNNVVRSPSDGAEVVIEFLKKEYGGNLVDRELFIALYLNTKNCVTGIEVISIGSLNASIVHPREAFKGAILHNAASLIVAHNHPSGDTTPSKEDISVTERLVEVGDVMGIEVLDHIIIGEGRDYLSLKEQGLI